ncbi:MAG: hypothetical protein JWQ10_2250 [Herbaspirillum sp.]|jgi:hypothetical protein|nr:hypothetical protein [Herbaspirillum sp.]
MIGKKGLVGLLIVGVMASSVSTSAFARGGDGLGIVAGVLGAVAVGSIIANSAPRPVYYDAPQPYYGPPPQPVYYQSPQPVYYQAPPRYYEPRPVYVHEYHHRDYYDHDGYYSR